MAMTDTTAPVEPFDAFQTAGEIFGFVYAKLGADALRELLAADAERPSTSESLSDAAAELDAVGLNKAAAIVREFAAIAPSEMDLSPYPLGTINHRAWLASMKRRR